MQESADMADYLQRFSTKVIWHFTGYSRTQKESFGILKKILLERKLIVKQAPSKIKMPSGKDRYGYPCSCMCDIPFKDLRIHTARYGKYGIAFDKEKAIKYGHFNPVLYIHKKHPLFKYTENNLLDAIDKLAEQKNVLSKKLRVYMGILGMFIKRCDLTSKIELKNIKLDEEQNNNFYYEREWRSHIDWEFKVKYIEAIMIPKKDWKELKLHLEEYNINDVPIVTYEMVKNL